MKVNFVLPTTSKAPSGGFKVIFDYANYLALNDNDVAIYFITNNLMNKYSMLPNRLKSILKEFIVKIRPTWYLLNKKIHKIGVDSVKNSTIRNADVVIASAISTAFEVNALNNRKGKKIYLIQDFENWRSTDEKVLESYSLGMTNITVAKWIKEIVDIYAKYPSICISNAIDTDIFKITNPIESRKRHSIAFHYRSEKKKGCIYAIEAIDILSRKYKDLEVYVVSSEKNKNGYFSKYKFFYNVKPVDVAKINNSVSIFLCTSTEEGFGLPGLEAMACGCALVSTNYRGVREYAIDGVNSLLSPIKDTKDIVENIEKLFNDDELRIKIAKQGEIDAKSRSLQESCSMFLNVISIEK